ncbi:MAG: DNA polymerase III subunit delta [Myxococcota bacterium]
MTPDALREELAAGRLRPAYLLAGEEALLREESLAALREAVLGDAVNDFDLDRLEGDRTGAGALLDALRALPVLAERRLVVLREPEGRKSRSEGLVEALAGTVAELAAQEQTVLVVVTARIDRRSRWVKAFAEPAALVACDPPKGTKAVAAFAAAEARRNGITLGAGAAQALAEAVGPQLLRLRSELEKAALLAGPGKRVSRDHVLEAVSAVSEEKIWELTDATFDGRSADALVALSRLLGGGVAAPVVLGALASQLRKLVRARAGETPRGHPFVVRRIETQARRQSLPRLLVGLRAAAEADERLKGRGGLPAERVLERLVLGLSS